MKTSQHLGKRLQQERLRFHLSQEALAEALGVSPRSISRWERGQSIPRGYIRLKLSRFFGLQPEDLFVELDERLSPSSFYNMPGPPSPCFTGREQVLELLHGRLGLEWGTKPYLAYALQGLGGIGKTQIALMYVQRYSAEYQTVLWINSENSESIFASIESLARLLQLPEANQADHQSIVDGLRRWLAVHDRWLLVCDNLTDPKQLQDYLPPVRRGSILITTHNQTLGPFAQGLNLAPLGKDEGTLFLLRRTKLLPLEATDEHKQQFALCRPDEYAAAWEVVSLLGGLPLALDQAGAYIEETGCSLAEYVQRYKQQRALLLGRRGLSGGEHPESVATTFLLASQQVEREQQAALDLLRVCAFLHAEAIPEELFRVGAIHLGPSLEPLARDALQFDLAIATLRRFSLVQRQPETQSLSIHRLVQEVLKASMNAQEQISWMRRIILVLTSLFPGVISDTWKQCERLLSHVLAVANEFPDGIEDQALAEILQKAADYYRERYQYRQADEWYQRALHIWEQYGEAGYPGMAHVYNGLALLNYDQGQYQQAEICYQQALDAGQRGLGETHYEVVRALMGQALLYQTVGKYAEAEPLYLHTIGLLEQSQAEPARLAYLYSNLADLYLLLGKYERSESLALEARQIWAQAFGEMHTLVTYPLLTLAELYTEQGKYRQAEPLYQQVLTIRDQLLGPADPYVAEALVGLADLYLLQGKYNQADSLYQRALHIQELVRGPTHPSLTRCLNGLARLYAQQEKKEQAERLYRRALMLQEKRLGLDHPETAQILYDLALLQQRQGFLVEARAFAERALQIRKACLGVTHPKTKAAHMLYSRLLI
ncbi:FxSxx-COOH system tetratricopeptide repeat protein [Ktedonosporobacter rubrisoli]|nr:FxSxx-COOH system tetratricopeptide repeat protein [Ktedonosporobacter rubrisoli]